VNERRDPNVTTDLPSAPAESARPADALHSSDRISGSARFEPSHPAVDAPGSPPGYELLDEIGRGGMGIVYRARDRALDRAVAVKLLSERYPADSKAAERFLNEARITGQLQHPGIPAVHQVGALADGRPFLAMKLIKGSTLEAILKQRTDPSAERGRLLAIFEAVCQAVGYAHAHRVIHRDLKPANVMVGAFGEVQVMDWGLAKVLGLETPATAEALTAETRAWTEVSPTPDAGSHTQAGSLVGTPAFIAPEQAAGEIERVNDRSDVFGLGAILAVILTGKPPYVGPTFESVRVQAVRGKLESCFARLDTAALEPEWVALCKKCLAFEPAERPADAGEVAQAAAGLRAAADERARRAELVRVQAEGEAREALARAAEQRRRRRLLLAASGIIALVLLAGLSVSLWQMRRAMQAEAAANTNAEQATLNAEEANEEKHKALRNLAFAKKGNEILSSVFAGLDPKANYVTVAELRNALRDNLNKAVKDLEGSAIGEPLEVAAMQNRLGLSLLGLGEAALAVDVFQKALDTRKAKLGPDHPDTLKSMNNLATAYQDSGQLAKAVTLHEDTLKKRKAKLGPDHPDTLSSMNNLADAYAVSGQLAKAVPLLEQSLQKYKAKVGAEHPETLVTMSYLGLVLLQQKKWADAEPVLRDCLAGRQKQIPDRWQTFCTQSMLGGALLGQKKYAEAEPLLVKGYEGMKTREKTIPKQGGAELRIPEALDRLIELYTAINQPDEAKKWQAERAKYPQGKTKTPEKK
jgi:serine/threonine protein kinase